MSHHPDDSGPVPEAPPLAPAHPAPVADPTLPVRPEPGPWPESGHAAAAFDASWSAHGPEKPEDAPEPGSDTSHGAARSGRRHARRGRPEGRRSRLPWAAGSLLLVGAAGVLALWPGDSEPENDPSVRRPDLSVPVLPGANPSTGDSPSSTPSARGTATSSAAASPSASPSEKPPAPSRPASTPPEQHQTLRMGDQGPEVTALQQRLQGQGFTYVHITGVYDGQTKRGVAQLQRDRDIKGDPTGTYGPATRAAFGI
ncbi:peptidoglycan-binding protein [Streptomyces sp. NPDC047718]|uniref:peptidoglycan-binding domain-containing protein n=1 Tax=Streptomyces sp. NPDC047718 TaxID=3155479 RepID=UPI003402E323